MASRRLLVAIVPLAAALHAIGMARAVLPAQDGLKFIRIAREFQTRPWIDVVRGADQHPLYPALVAVAEPVVSAFLGKGPEAWRVAAQSVSATAAVALLFPLFGLTRVLFDERIATLAVVIYVLLPLPSAVGHDTLSDSLALLGFVAALRLGEMALHSRGWHASVACGLVAGLGFLARPEVLVAPAAVFLVSVMQWRHPSLDEPPVAPRRQRTSRFIWRLPDFYRAISFSKPEPHTRPSGTLFRGEKGLGEGRFGERNGPADFYLPIPPRAVGKLAALAIPFLATVGGYALIKGEVSEKLALRQGVGQAARAPTIRPGGHPLPAGLDDPCWDFSPKEESEEPSSSSSGSALRLLVWQWAEGLAGVFAFFAAWGFVRDRFIRGLLNDGEDPARARRWSGGRRLIAAYLVLFAAVLVRHAMRMGYVSGRHTLTLVIVSVPWAAAGIWVCARRLAEKRGWSDRLARTIGASALAGSICVGVAFQVRPGHPSRWGHWAAGRWLRTHSAPGDAVLDTRGWGAFVSGRPSYDYWHVRQAFTDSRLAYIVVGTDELEASSRRGATLRAVLAYAATPCAEFPERPGDREVGVRVYRYRRPDSWEGLSP